MEVAEVARQLTLAAWEKLAEGEAHPGLEGLVGARGRTKRGDAVAAFVRSEADGLLGPQLRVLERGHGSGKHPVMPEGTGEWKRTRFARSPWGAVLLHVRRTEAPRAMLRKLDREDLAELLGNTEGQETRGLAHWSAHVGSARRLLLRRAFEELVESLSDRQRQVLSGPAEGAAKGLSWRTASSLEEHGLLSRSGEDVVWTPLGEAARARLC